MSEMSVQIRRRTRWSAPLVAALALTSVAPGPVGCAPEPTEQAQGPEQHPWRHEAPDGSIHLWTVDHMHVMNMVAWALQNQRYDLMLRDVIAEETKQAYRGIGRDPLEAVQWMVENEGDIYRLFSLFRIGGSQSVWRLEKAGPKRFRMKVFGERSEIMRVTEMEVVMENRVWKLAVIR